MYCPPASFLRSHFEETVHHASSVNYEEQRDRASISRILYLVRWDGTAIISLVPLSRTGSSDLPEGKLLHFATQHDDADNIVLFAEIPSYVVLLRVGLVVPSALLPKRWALTPPFHPYPSTSAGRYIFCDAFRCPARAEHPPVRRYSVLRSSDFPSRQRRDDCMTHDRHCSQYRSPDYQRGARVDCGVCELNFFLVLSPDAPSKFR